MRQSKSTLNTLDVCLDVLSVLPRTDVVATIVDAIRSENYGRVYNHSFPVMDSQYASKWPIDYFAYNLLRKFPFRGVDRKAVAIASFEAGEAQCAETNRRLSLDFRAKTSARNRIYWLRAKIAKVLGRFDWNSVERDFAWGPGASTRLCNAEGDVYFKFRGKPETTLQNLPLAVAAVGRIPLWFGEIHPLHMRDMFTVVAGSKVTTVPKDAKTDRTIAIEPCMNMFIQKGIGSAIRRRLRKVGVDLNDQSKNQYLASVAEINGLATVDISAASDTVSAELVELLLPDDWLSALKLCRSPRYILNSSIGTFEKFSTMGNGYTFELESLLFWAITSLAVHESSVADRTVAIYGDDIICHGSAIESLYELLTYFGFKPNVDKSFSSGHFRESCGKHYFHGCDVTPVYVKDRIDSPDRLAWFANSIARWGDRIRLSGHSAVGLLAWTRAIAHVPSLFRLPIPNGVGDGGVVLPFVSRQEELPEDLRGFFPDLGKEAVDYQRGYTFNHRVKRFIPQPLRDPTDVPYLLRGLYRLERKPTTQNLFSGAPGDYPPGAITGYEKWATARGWSSCWHRPNLMTED